MAEAKFKAGDRVRAVGEAGGYGTTVTEQVGTVVSCSGRGFVRVAFPNFPNGLVFTPDEVRRGDLELVTESTGWDDLSAGDILIDGDDEEREVFATAGKLVAVHDGDDDGLFDADWLHKDRLKRDGWKIKGAGSTDVTELSVAEIEEKLNLEAGTLRVKKD